MGSNLEYIFGGQGSFSEGVDKKFVSKLSVKNQWGRERESNYVIFLVWSALIVGGGMVVAWSRNSCLGPAEIASFVLLVLFREGIPL